MSMDTEMDSENASEEEEEEDVEEGATFGWFNDLFVFDTGRIFV
jgi:hypothetical protein